jgi:hypothetical protein
MARGKYIARLIAGHFRGEFGAVLRRFTWEFPQTMMGGVVGVYVLLRAQIFAVEIFDGVVVIAMRWPHKGRFWGGISFASVILGDESIAAKVNNRLFMHEFGHTLQSRQSGPIYLLKYGFPSVLSAKGKGTHRLHPVERDANIRAMAYFRALPDFTPWPMDEFPLPVNSRRLHIGWWEYIPPIVPILHVYKAWRDRNGVKEG